MSLAAYPMREGLFVRRFLIESIAQSLNFVIIQVSQPCKCHAHSHKSELAVAWRNSQLDTRRTVCLHHKSMITGRPPRSALSLRALQAVDNLQLLECAEMAGGKIKKPWVRYGTYLAVSIVMFFWFPVS